MRVTRRDFMTRTGVGLAGAMLFAGASKGADIPMKFPISACDWSLGERNKLSGLDVAKNAGLDGLEVSPGDAADVLPLADPALQKQYKDKARELGLTISSTAMGLLNQYPLASDPRGPAWLEQIIDATAALDTAAKVILLAFFGKGDLIKKSLLGNRELKTSDVDVVVERLKDAAPRAEKAGVILGLENTLSAEQNWAIIERVKSDAVQVYYDIRNSTDNGYDVPAEIRLLGDRICQFHFKDGGAYLGEGKVAMEPVAEAIHAINYTRWICLETSAPSKDREADFRKNADYTRALLSKT